MKPVASQLRSVALRYRDRRVATKASILFVSGRIGRLESRTASARISTNQLARRSRLEAILFVARGPLTLRKLAQAANLTDGTEARTLLTDLRQCYDSRGSAFQVEHLAGGYQLMTRSKFAPWLRPRVAGRDALRLSPPALETLAVAAYRQPVLRSEVEAVRGVSCGEILRQLLERDLLRIVGRSEELGRPLLYGTTKLFLQTFGLSNLDQLPMAEELRRHSSEDDDAATAEDMIRQEVNGAVANDADAA
jgi:segregation and condensation protein B